MRDIESTIYLRLQSLNPVQIKLINDSHLHDGHINKNGGGHYQLLIVSNEFTDLSRITRQRKIHQLLQDLFDQHIIHALSIKALTHNEYLAL